MEILFVPPKGCKNGNLTLNNKQILTLHKKSLKNKLRTSDQRYETAKDRVIFFSDLSESDEKKLFCVDQYLQIFLKKK